MNFALKLLLIYQSKLILSCAILLHKNTRQDEYIRISKPVCLVPFWRGILILRQYSLLNAKLTKNVYKLSGSTNRTNSTGNSLNTTWHLGRYTYGRPTCWLHVGFSRFRHDSLLLLWLSVPWASWGFSLIKTNGKTNLAGARERGLFPFIAR